MAETQTKIHETSVSDGITIKEQYVNFKPFLNRVPIPSKSRKSVEDMIDDPQEADRVLGYVLGKKKDMRHYIISDFSSFKEAFRDAFSIGGKGSHARLWDTIGGQDDLLLRLYAQADIQDKVTRDGKEGRVMEIMSRYHIQRREADDMYARVRQREIELVKQGKLPTRDTSVQIVVPEIPQVIVPSVRLISQVTKEGGRVYQRTKPIAYTIPQIRFLRNNGEVPTRKVTAQFNILFHENRTQNSIYNKRYRLLRRGE